MVLDSDTIQNTLPHHLAADVEIVRDSLQTGFGQYDFFSTDSTRLFFDFGKSAAATAMPPLPTGSIGTAMPFSLWVDSAFFLLFLFCFMFFAFVFRWEGTALKGNLKNVFTPAKYSTSTHKSQVTKTEVWGEFYLIFQAVVVFSILIFSWLRSNGLSMFSPGMQSLTFVLILAVFGLLVYSKMMGYRLIGTFFLKEEMGGWTTYYSRMMEVLGIVFFLPAVFYVFLHETRDIILVALLVVFFISRLIIYIELLNIFVKNKIAPFYFFVYLCGTEIAPYLLLYKGVISVINIAGDNII